MIPDWAIDKKERVQERGISQRPGFASLPQPLTFHGCIKSGLDNAIFRAYRAKMVVYRMIG
jgi:hypothetical protein